MDFKLTRFEYFSNPALIEIIKSGIHLTNSYITSLYYRLLIIVYTSKSWNIWLSNFCMATNPEML